MDNGLSIPGRFDKSNVDFIDDCNAIEKAINNVSTVSDNPYERGNGLWATIRLVIEGNGGEILIVSRNVLLYIAQAYYTSKKCSPKDITEINMNDDIKPMMEMIEKQIML